MNAEQEIRAKALELKMNSVAMLVSACITKGRSFDGTGIWADGDLEEFVDYITSGKKPKAVNLLEGN